MARACRRKDHPTLEIATAIDMNVCSEAETALVELLDLVFTSKSEIYIDMRVDTWCALQATLKLGWQRVGHVSNILIRLYQQLTYRLE